MIHSSYDFIKIARSVRKPTHTASLDVESLFTNVPVNETIDIILECVYVHEEIPKPIVPAPILKKLLILCTTKFVFKSHDVTLFLQVDGVNMGSPLRPTFANYYMGHL